MTKQQNLLNKLKQLHQQYADQASEYLEYVERNQANQFHDDYTLAIADMSTKFVDQLAALIDEFEASK
jgi:hypothetical protein